MRKDKLLEVLETLLRAYESALHSAAAICAQAALYSENIK